MGNTTSAPQSAAQVASKQCTQVPFTHYIILCLSYSGLSLDNGFKLDLDQSKNDFHLLLKHFGYFRNDNQTQFTLLNDFDYFPNDDTSCADPKPLPKADASKEAIRNAIRSTMQQTIAGSKVYFHFSGHGLDEAVFAGDGQLIHGSELRSWLSDGVDSSVAVTTVLDTCSNGNVLGLPYNYNATSSGVRVEQTEGEKSSVPILQISAAGKGQGARSAAFSEGDCGLLTRFVSRYFEKLLLNPQATTIDDIVHFLNERFEATERRWPQLSSPHVSNESPKPQGIQKPHFSCSVKLEDRFHFF
ncbi:hypothetical protein FRC04_003939 [Tulasnella sp. 424]|nr:hypothetical protein FRC04_003939 [Tulasnella sp. 424]